jgi:5-formyltetrahydrofolate cyclo-ligase
MDLCTRKAGLRQQIKQRLPCKRTAESDAWSRAACEHFCRTEAFDRARSVMVFLSLPGEIETSLALERCWQVGKTVLVPRVDWERHEIDAIALTPDTVTSLHRYGLREPSGGEAFEPRGIDLVAVPGLAFDAVGRRLGRGAGFYDRFLPRASNATRCGLAWEVQFVEEVPAGENDVRLDLLATETGIRQFPF